MGKEGKGWDGGLECLGGMASSGGVGWVGWGRVGHVGEAVGEKGGGRREEKRKEEKGCLGG